MNSVRKRIAVIGSGISGLASAYFLRRAHDVVLYEAGNYLGGHANTVDITLDGQTFGVDTGFLVYNERTYPNLVALFGELGVATIGSDMSFGVSANNGALEWAGTDLDTVFAQRRRIASPAFLGMIANILHFNRHASRFLEDCERRTMTLGDLLSQQGYGEMFRDAYLLPMAAAIWSSSPQDILGFPAATFLRFCLNHALLQISDRPQWRTVRGGSRHYVQAVAATLPDCRLNTPVQSVRRAKDGLTVNTLHGDERFDHVVFATHPPTTLALLADADLEQRAVLGAVRYQPNTAWLHTDTALMPRLRKVWSAWNYLGSRHSDGSRAVCVSYWLNRLQDLPCKTDIVLTLNPPQPPDPATVMGRFDYEHPVFDQPAIDAQRRLPEIQGKHRAWFAGAWTGYGFHEDGLKSALRVTRDFGVTPHWAVL